MTGPDPAEVAGQLRAALESMTSASDVVPDPVLTAYLSGAADALGLMAERDRPDVNEPGQSIGDGPPGT